MTMKAQGKPTRAIRETVDAKYLRYGPPTPTPRP
jgi:hypothetical protein